MQFYIFLHGYILFSPQKNIFKKMDNKQFVSPMFRNKYHSRLARDMIISMRVIVKQLLEAHCSFTAPRVTMSWNLASG